MNSYYATGFLSALFFWVWPAWLYRSLDVHWAWVLFFTAVLFFGVGRAATELHIRFIAKRGTPGMVAACAVIFAIGWMTRLAYDALRAGPGGLE